jgi:hypothetical protein
MTSSGHVAGYQTHGASFLQPLQGARYVSPGDTFNVTVTSVWLTDEEFVYLCLVADKEAA